MLFFILTTESAKGLVVKTQQCCGWYWRNEIAQTFRGGAASFSLAEEETGTRSCTITSL